MPRPSRTELWLLAVAGAIVLALITGYTQQRRAIPAALRHVPVDSDYFVVSAPIAEAWRGLQPHLAPYFEKRSDKADESKLGRYARELREELNEKDILLDSPEDLPKLGIDPHAPAAVALVRKAGQLRTLAVLPVLNREKFIAALERFLVRKSQPVMDRPGAMLRIGGTWLAFGEDRWGLLSDDADVLAEALRATSRRLDDWRSSDRIAQAFSSAALPLMRAPQAWLRGRLRPPDPLPAGGEMLFAISGDERMLDFNGRIVLAQARSQFAADLLRKEPPRPADRVLPRSDLAITLASASLPTLLRDLLAVAESLRWRPLGDMFAPVLAEVRRGEGIERLSVAASDTFSRVPGVVMGLQMSAADADAFVLRLQASLRLARDREVLKSAAEGQRSQHAGGPPAPAALLESGRIAPETGALWLRYQWKDGTAVAVPPLSAADFATDIYQSQSAGGLALRYLMPRFTDNDLKYRFAGRREELQLEELKADRYRLCSVYQQDTLWIGNDAPVLVDWIGRLTNEAPPGPYADAAAGIQTARAKALVLALPARLLEAAQLYPSNKINAGSREMLGDLAPYATALLSVSAGDYVHELHVHARLLRR